MEKPTKPYPPFQLDYAEKVERRYVYSFTESMHEDDGWDEGDKEPEPAKPIAEVDLAWLLTQIPEGVTAEQIKIEFGYNASSMSYDDCFIKFYYEVIIPARKTEFKAAKVKYQANLKQYEQDVVAYEQECREKEIKATEEKLKRLKNGL